MFEKISRRSEGTLVKKYLESPYLFLTALDDMIEELSEVVKAKYKVEELGDPSSLTEVCFSNFSSECG